MNSEIKQWLEGFTEHLIAMGEKFGSQSAYGRQVNIPPHYMSQLVNKRYQEFSKNMILVMAERAGYDRENYRSVCQMFAKVDTSEWKNIKSETAVQYENTRRRERDEFGGDMPGEVIENTTAVTPRTAKPQDLYLIERYIDMRNTLPLSKTDQPVIRKALLHNLCADLQKLDEKELC